ncbi:MAG: hypothetical protein WC002_10725 [Candidatus Muiribacteriota bacterium]
MKFLIILTGILIIISKLFDVLSTIKILNSPYQERNIIARKIMIKIGIKTTCWITWILIVIFVTYYTYKTILSENPLELYGFIIIGNIISIFQFAIAHYNHTGKNNTITKLLRKTIVYK